MSSLKKIVGVLILLQFCACASHHPKPDSSLGANGNAVISNEPMNFSAQGSDSGKYAGLTSVHFVFDSSAVLATEKQLISQDAAWIKAHPNMKIQIEGHCDQRGSVEYNLALGERRAKAIYNALVAQGIDKSRLSVISYGEERPLVQGDTEEAYAKNRRANFVPMNGPQNTLTSN